MYLLYVILNIFILQGITSKTISKPSTITQEELLEIVESVNRDDTVDGVLVQLPLPEHIGTLLLCTSTQ